MIICSSVGAGIALRAAYRVLAKPTLIRDDAAAHERNDAAPGFRDHCALHNDRARSILCRATSLRRGERNGRAGSSIRPRCLKTDRSAPTASRARCTTPTSDRQSGWMVTVILLDRATPGRGKENVAAGALPSYITSSSYRPHGQPHRR